MGEGDVEREDAPVVTRDPQRLVALLPVKEKGSGEVDLKRAKRW